MGFNALIAKVQQAEAALESRERRTGEHWRQWKAIWRAAWTPGRIVVAGLAAGFVAGRVQPLKLAGKGRDWLKLLQLAAPLLAGVAARAVDDDPRAAYFRQVLNGKYIRMALILKLLGID